MINRNVIGAICCGLCILFAPITNIKVNAQTLDESAEATQTTEDAEIVSEDTKIDKSLSTEELAAKYEGKTYREIKEENLSNADMVYLMKRFDSIKQTAPIEITEEEKELLYRLVFAEGGNQSYETQMYICSVILNRIRSSEFPNTVEEVIYQTGQFSVVSNGSINSPVTEQITFDAVNDVLENGITNSDITFFRNDYYHQKMQDEFVSGVLYFSSLPA